MIEWLKNWIVTICTAVIFITCVELILPNNKMKKYAKFVLGLILVVVLLNPIIKLFHNNDINSFINNADMYINNSNDNKLDLKEYKNINKEKTLAIFEKKLKSSCEKILENKYSENSYKVKVKAKFDKNTSKLNILKVSVGVGEKDKIAKVDKIEININSNKDKNLPLNGKNEKIRTYLSKQLNIPKESINIYKLKGEI